MVLRVGDFLALGAAGRRSLRALSGSGRRPVKKRISGDRRTRSRFEIVGTLPGTLETWQQLGVKNVGAGGALIESKVALPVGSILRGRLSLHGQTREVKAEVRHTIERSGRRDSDAFLIGIKWLETTGPIDDLLMGDGPAPRRANPRAEERRSARRVAAMEGAEITRPTWDTIELVDISAGGVSFLAPHPVGVGERAQLRLRLGDKSFAAQITIRRSDMYVGRAGTYRIGAAFLTLDEESRVTLERFIATARH